MKASKAAPAGSSWLPDWLKLGPVLRYGVSTAFGALLVIAIYESRPDYGEMTDITELVGTMAPDAEVNQRAVLDRFSFDRTGVASIARLEQREDAFVLDVRVDTNQVVEVAIDLSASGMDLEALAQSTNNIETIQFADQILRVKGRGQRRFAVLLRERSDAAPAAEIELEYSSNGQVVQQGTLSSTR